MLLSEENKPFAKVIQKKYIPPESLFLFCEDIRKDNKTIVTLNGSFDLLHPGHLEMLYQGSLLADVFIVLLNTDQSIQSYKHPNRPINSLEIRKQIMAAIEMVDYVSWFSETDPREILAKIRPHVHVNGGEYGKNCIEAEVVEKNGGKIHIVELLENYSSSNIVKKIQNLCD